MQFGQMYLFLCKLFVVFRVFKHFSLQHKNTYLYAFIISLEYIGRQIESSDWVTLLFVGCIVFYAVSRWLYPKRFQEFILLPITNKYFLVQGRNNVILHPFNILLFIPQIISVSLLIFLVMRIEFPEIVSTNRWLYLHICTGYTGFILIKYYVEKIIGTVFSIEPVLNQYLYQKLTYRNLLALLVFTANLVFFYIFEPSLLILGIFAGILIIINAITLFYSYKMNGNFILRNFFYFILYLCALEISPYLVLFKVFLIKGAV